MNTDIRIAIDFWQHPKTKKLIRRVGIEGIRSLQILWTWAANNKSDGNLAGLDEEDIELAADWQGDIGVFFKALVEVRWIDETDSGYALHEWLEHNPWVADDENRSNKARLSKLQQVNAAAYNKCVQEGKTGLTKEEYESLKGYSANAEQKDGDCNHKEKQENSGQSATAERPQSDRKATAEGNASETLAPKPSPIPTVLNTPLSPKGDIPPRGETAKAKKETIAQVIDEQAGILRAPLIEFVEHRKRLRKGLTPHALRLCIQKLESLAPGNLDRQKYLVEYAIMSGWQTFFEPKEDKPRPSQQGYLTEAERRQAHNDAVCRQVAAELEAADSPF